MTPCRSSSLNSAYAAFSLAASRRLYFAATGLPSVSMWCCTLWITGGRSFAVLKTAEKSRSRLAIRMQVFCVTRAASGLRTGALYADTATEGEEEPTAATEGEEEPTAAIEGEEESTAAREGEEGSTAATEGEERSTAELAGSATNTAAGRIPHLLKELPPTGETS